MSGKAPDIVEQVSAVPFDATLERLTTAVAQAGLILFSRIDHQAGHGTPAWRCRPRRC
jgi:uncharacterized protein (DUF302 family)